MTDKTQVVAALDQLEAEGLELLRTRTAAAETEYELAHRFLSCMNLHFAAGLIAFGMAYLRNKEDDRQRDLEELESV